MTQALGRGLREIVAGCKPLSKNAQRRILRDSDAFIFTVLDKGGPDKGDPPMRSDLDAFLSLPPHSVFVVGLRFYVASQLAGAEAVKALAALLKREGHSHTYDWTTHGRCHVPGAGDQANIARMREVSEAEGVGVTSADVVVVWLPGGRGTHVEIGMAIAAGKRVILCSPTPLVNEEPYPSAFYFHPTVRQIVESNEGMRMYKAVQAVREYTVERRRLQAQFNLNVKVENACLTSSILDGFGAFLHDAPRG